jgi:hypothetical protein
MPNLPESSQWEAGVYQIELTDPVQGGANGIANLQAKQLANRTKFLHDGGDGFQSAAPGGFDPAVAPLAADRRRLVVVEGGAGVPDSCYIAVKLGDDSYAWRQIF